MCFQYGGKMATNQQIRSDFADAFVSDTWWLLPEGFMAHCFRGTL